MHWSSFHGKFNISNIPVRDLKGVAFVYILSHKKHQPPYKIGITKADLYRRMSNYQTVFIDFDIAYIVAMPFDQVRALETALHKEVSNRIQFPHKRKDQARTIYSEWFDVPLSKVSAALHKITTTNSKSPLVIRGLFF